MAANLVRHSSHTPTPTDETNDARKEKKMSQPSFIQDKRHDAVTWTQPRGGGPRVIKRCLVPKRTCSLQDNIACHVGNNVVT